MKDSTNQSETKPPNEEESSCVEVVDTPVISNQQLLLEEQQVPPLLVELSPSNSYTSPSSSSAGSMTDQQEQHEHLAAIANAVALHETTTTTAAAAAKTDRIVSRNDFAGSQQSALETTKISPAAAAPENFKDASAADGVLNESNDVVLQKGSNDQKAAGTIESNGCKMASNTTANAKIPSPAAAVPTPVGTSAPVAAVIPTRTATPSNNPKSDAPSKTSKSKPMFSSSSETPLELKSDIWLQPLQPVPTAQQIMHHRDLEEQGIDHVNVDVEAQQQLISAIPANHTLGLSYMPHAISSLTRHDYYNTLPLGQLVAIALADVWHKLVLHQPWQWPRIISRILTAVWHQTLGLWGTRQTGSYLENGSSLPLGPWMTPTQPAKPQPPVVQGLPNFGQTCFLNVILQALASLDSVLAYAEHIACEQERRYQLSLLEEDDYDDEDETDEDDAEDGQKRHHRRRMRRQRRRQRRHHNLPTESVSQLLHPLLQALNGQVLTTTTATTNRKNNSPQNNYQIRQNHPKHLLWRVAEKNSQFQARNHFSHMVGASGGEQQDAQELLQALLEMLIDNATLEDSYTVKRKVSTTATSSSSSRKPVGMAITAKTSNQPQSAPSKVVTTNSPSPASMLASSTSSEYFYLTEEKKDEVREDDDDADYHSIIDDEVLTSLSDRWSPRSSAFISPCSSEVMSDPEEAVGTGTIVSSGNCHGDAAWNHVQMLGSSGFMTSYQKTEMNDDNTPVTPPNECTSLASSFLSTTSTVVTSPSAHSQERQRQQQQLRRPQGQEDPPAMSASMQIMLSTISSITKTPLSCWTGSLVQCQRCHHVKAVRNQEWRDIPVVPTAISAPGLVSKSGPGPRPCALTECLRHFTQVERVSDVECGNCTLQMEIQYWQDEIQFLQGQRESMERKKQQDDPLYAMNQNELEEACLKLYQLQQLDPDEYDPNGICNDTEETAEFEIETVATKPAKKMIRADALKCLMLTRLPSVLCLHVQRRCYDPMTDRMSKTSQHVAFEEFLDVAPYCAFGDNGFQAFDNRMRQPCNNGPPKLQSPIWYRLTCVVEHRGDAFHGHYVCYRKLPTCLQSHSSSANEWHYISDDVVHPTTWDQVQRAQAYMLFYEAI